MHLVVLDTETTGLSRAAAAHGVPCAVSAIGSEVIQIGGLVLDSQANPLRSFCYYCDCMLPELSEDVQRINGLSMRSIREHVPNVFPEDIVLRKLPELLANDVVVIGHNISFDLQMLTQSTRNCLPPFTGWPRVMSKIPSKGKAFLDTMSYLPKRAKLISFYTDLTPLRNRFYGVYGKSLPLDTNCPELLAEEMRHAHNALFDAIETYLLFLDKIWKKKVAGGGFC